MRGAAGVVLSVLALSVAGCNVVPSRDPTGEAFPDVRGRTLAGEDIETSGVLAQGPVILIMPFTSDAERDRDAWKNGLAGLATPVRIYELGAVPSTAGILLAPVINRSRRDHRPEEAWASTLVFTGDAADRIVTQTGMGQAQFARVLLVGTNGTIEWFADQGFDAARLEALDRRARELQSTFAESIVDGVAAPP